jgi:enamine deaminase RidA (YjgF/YER057c/UK114 family)
MLMSDQANIRVNYVPRQELLLRPQAWWQGVLGIVSFGRGSQFVAAPGVPVAPVALPELGAGQSTCEVWQVSEPLRSGHIGPVHYRAGTQVLFGRVVLEEPGSAGSDRDRPTPLQEMTAQAYAQVFAALDSLGFPNLLRVWNYFAEINSTTPLGERYHEFNTARRQAFLQARRVIAGQVPAACALGSAAGSPLVLYFLASATTARSLENPRQLSAFRYPVEYGPDSPIFSRAVLATALHGSCLFTSGTASILGHKTVHAGNAAAQTRESIANIVELVAEANRVSGTGCHSIDDMQFKVYVRDASNLDEIRQELALLLPGSCPITYLQADICRRDLLVEIEAVGNATPAASTESR